MPKRARELTALDVKRLEHRGGPGNETVAVGGVAGLLMQLSPGGGSSWLLRTRIGGRRREIGLGSYPSVTLGMARERARVMLDKIAAGIDPVEERKATRAALVAAQKRGLTFAEAVERFLASKLDEFRNAKHRAQWRATLDTYARPAIGEMQVSEIGVGDVQRAPASDLARQDGNRQAAARANRERARMATVAGHRSGDNPARWRGNLDALLPKPSKVAAADNHPALALDDAPAWFVALRTREGVSARALQFLALTAARSGEVRGATWGEVDLDAKLWTIPAGRMKAGREHRVPLTDAAVALLRAQEARRLAGSDFVFPAARGGQLSDMSLRAVMRRMQEAEVAAKRKGWLDPRSGRPAVPHGLRSTFRDWAAERTKYPREMAEIALAHNVGSEVERAYRRGDMVERRRAMMQGWGRFLGGDSSSPKVVALGERRA